MITISRWLGTGLGLVACLVLTTACTPSQSEVPSPATSVSPATPPPAESPTGSPSPTSEANSSYATLPRLNGEAVLEMVVNNEVVSITLAGADAPITAGNFVDLVSQKFYDGLMFHRVVREPQPFVVQGGDPQSKDPNFPAARLGTGGYVDAKTGLERNIPLEILPKKATEILYEKTFQMANVNDVPKLNHRRGAVAMARSQFPNSASSQFYITLADVSFLDGSYAVFGYVTEGMDVVDQIQQGDRIESITVVSGIENFTKPE
ncbi:MAG: peptidylprolyl isomerase [Prochlorotrichaceae cyanobacterium]